MSVRKVLNDESKYFIFSAPLQSICFCFVSITSMIPNDGKNKMLLSFQMGAVWNELQPKLSCLFVENNGLKPALE